MVTFMVLPNTTEMTIYRPQPAAPADYDNECRICYETMATTRGLARPCGHDCFHRECLTKWEASCVGHCRCPCCNQNVDEIMDAKGNMVKTTPKSAWRQELAEFTMGEIVLLLFVVMFALNWTLYVLVTLVSDCLLFAGWSAKAILAFVKCEEWNESEFRPAFTTRAVISAGWLIGMRDAMEKWQHGRMTTQRFLAIAAASTVLLSFASF